MINVGTTIGISGTGVIEYFIPKLVVRTTNLMLWCRIGDTTVSEVVAPAATLRKKNSNP